MPVKFSDAVNNLPSVEVGRVEIPIVGLSPLSVFAWRAKAEAIGKAGDAEGLSDAEIEALCQKRSYTFHGSHPRFSGMHGLPPSVFKEACCSACRVGKSETGRRFTITKFKGMCFFESPDVAADRIPISPVTCGVIDPLVPIFSNGRKIMKTQIKWAIGGKARTYYYFKYVEWATVVRARYDNEALGLVGLLQAINDAGEHIGIGENRPTYSRKPSVTRGGSGDYGRFRVASPFSKKDGKLIPSDIWKRWTKDGDVLVLDKIFKTTE